MRRDFLFELNLRTDLAPGSSPDIFIWETDRNYNIHVNQMKAHKLNVCPLVTFDIPQLILFQYLSSNSPLFLKIWSRLLDYTFRIGYSIWSWIFACYIHWLHVIYIDDFELISGLYSLYDICQKYKNWPII